MKKRENLSEQVAILPETHMPEDERLPEIIATSKVVPPDIVALYEEYKNEITQNQMLLAHRFYRYQMLESVVRDGLIFAHYSYYVNNALIQVAPHYDISLVEYSAAYTDQLMHAVHYESLLVMNELVELHIRWDKGIVLSCFFELADSAHRFEFPEQGWNILDFCWAWIEAARVMGVAATEKPFFMQCKKTIFFLVGRWLGCHQRGDITENITDVYVHACALKIAQFCFRAGVIEYLYCLCESDDPPLPHEWIGQQIKQSIPSAFSDQCMLILVTLFELFKNHD